MSYLVFCEKKSYNIFMESILTLYKIGTGPSSSHTMGPRNAAKWMRKHYPDAKKFHVILYGSLALTGKGHLTDVILRKILGKNTTFEWDIHSKIAHPNTLQIEAKCTDGNHIQRFISIGGGEILLEGEKKEKKDIYPFSNFQQIKEYCSAKSLDLSDFALFFEPNLLQKLEKVFKTMKKSIQNGLQKEGYLPGSIHAKRKAKLLYNVAIENEDSSLLRTRLVSSYAYAVSEENASGGIIVTAPTCGSSGVLPACLYYLERKYSLEEEKILRALIVAGIFGNIIRTNASISGAFAGCQAEIGTACSMASAAVTYLMGGTIEDMETAAEIAMEHHLGLTCDPIDGLVQIPCIERNATAALRALDAASLAPYLSSSRKISFDTIVKTMLDTGKDMKKEYKETASGGLAKHYSEDKEVL